VNRFKEQRIAHGYKTQSDLAKVLFVNQTAVSQWERDITTPSPPILLKLSEMYGVSTDYLLGRELVPKTSSKGVMIPVLGEVAAGIPIEAIENILDYEEISKEMAAHGEFFGLRLRGDSMAPRMCEGDVVIVKKQPDADTGDIAVVLVNGDSATVKNIRKERGGLWLIPNNPAAFEPRFLSREECTSLPVQILGIVVELRAKIKGI
jgi:repressor LexA